MLPSPPRTDLGSVPDPQLKLQLGEQSFKPPRMPARFHSHTHLHPLCRQITVEFLRFLAVLQSPLLQFPSLGIYKSNLLEARVVIASYNDHVRLLSPERSWLVGNHQSLLGYRSRHCHGINFTKKHCLWRHNRTRQVQRDSLIDCRGVRVSSCGLPRVLANVAELFF